MVYHLNIGSNLGDKRAVIMRAVAALSTEAGECAVSQFYESEPWGFESENAFVNVAVRLESDIAPLDMLHLCQDIERRLGCDAHRDSTGAYVDRIIDIDIILIDDLVINTPELTVPHPRMRERDFVMVPLQQILSDFDLDFDLDLDFDFDFDLDKLDKLDKLKMTLPSSKSIATRMLIINALSSKPRRLVVSDTCDDIDVMQAALASDSDTINVGAAGTAMRFLTAYFATRRSRTVVLDGSARMRERPIGHLVDALRQRGARIHYITNEGYPPLRIEGTHLSINDVEIDGSLSSQYVTALLLTAPVTGGCVVRLTGNISSRPYIEMTIGLMRRCGITVDTDESLRTITVHEGEYVFPKDFTIEADWSAASYWFGIQALIPSANIALDGLSRDSVQGDSHIAQLCDAMGVGTTWDGNILRLHNVPARENVVLEMESMPDIIPTIAVTLCLLRNPFTINGVRTLRIKESDRVAALQTELAKLGYTLLAPTPNSIAYDGNLTPVANPKPIETYKDHRIAMSMALAATRHPGITILDPAVVAKSYPRFWQHVAPYLSINLTK